MKRKKPTLQFVGKTVLVLMDLQLLTTELT